MNYLRASNEASQLYKLYHQAVTLDKLLLKELQSMQTSRKSL